MSVDRSSPAPWERWGDRLDPASIEQMEQACKLPITRRGALMPDAHVGYGLPIGGVLATAGAVVPYAVGVDIACRMKLSVLDLPTSALEKRTDRLIRPLEEETRFGVGSSFEARRAHGVMDSDWGVTAVTAGRSRDSDLPLPVPTRWHAVRQVMQREWTS